MADILQKHFCTFFSNPNSSEKRDPNFPAAQSSMDDIQLTLNDFFDAIDELKINSAPGEDEIPAILLKNCKEALALPLFKM